MSAWDNWFVEILCNASPAPDKYAAAIIFFELFIYSR